MPVGMCSNTHLIWRPLPHSIGYIVSKEKPSINKIRIIDSSKLSKTTISDMFYDSGQIGSSKGISLWNIENSDYFFCRNLKIKMMIKFIRFIPFLNNKLKKD